mmetsp:Transcript_3675/g.9554  ORF Transcript_3675/g.9554 Transcript_3675/m.9554 type:complete len:189 (-) Transcript_3675:163-729(-)
MLAIFLPLALGVATSTVRSPTACTARPVGRAAVHMGYVPDGLSPEQWAKMKKDEATKKQNLGGVGVDGKRFKSRSMESFMKALESGKGGHLFPVNPEKVKSGEIPLSKVPYMQRKGGSWDNSDIRGGKKSQWLQSDREYAAGGYKKYESFVRGQNLPWSTGATSRIGGSSNAGKGVKESGKKKLFGLF